MAGKVIVWFWLRCRRDIQKGWKQPDWLVTECFDFYAEVGLFHAKKIVFDVTFSLQTDR
jgi:hypothetical protein